MIWLKKRTRELVSDQKGMAALEFGLIAFPFGLVMMGAFDLGYQMYVRSVVEGSLANAARKASVEAPSFNGTGSTLKERVEETLKDEINAISRNATYTITIQNFEDFSGIGKPEKLTTDVNGNGQFDETDGDCWKDLNGNGLYDTSAGRDGIGGASDVIFYELDLTMPRMFPLAGLIGANESYHISAKTVFRSQPYSVTEVPNIECGEP
jgi:Flp pilus assembly pilin Flp